MPALTQDQVNSLERNRALVANNNITTTQGRAPSSPLARTSKRVQCTVPASGTIPLSLTGTSFYFVQTTGEIQVRPSGGIFVPYTTGTGLALDPVNAFSLLEFYNPTASAITFDAFVGFDAYIDKRLILFDPKNPQVINPVYDSSVAAANQVDVPDKSGAEFSDANGVVWIGVSRTALLVFNKSETTTINIRKLNASLATHPAIGAVYPLTTVRLDASGDYSCDIEGVPATNVTGIVSEIYSAIKKIV